MEGDDLKVVKKVFIDPTELRTNSFRLGRKVLDAKFIPDFMVCLWRGGAPVGCYVHEMLMLLTKQKVDHIAIRTSK